MSQRRYYIRAGAQTSAGGTVRSSSPFSLAHGVPLARAGDPVDCPRCGTEGRIGCVAPRLSDTYGGSEYALSDDLCICQCDPPPTLLADQHADYQLVAAAAPSLQA